jgi:hypothetical protein
LTDYLFARPSLIEGIGRNIDLFGVLNNYNYSTSGEEADLRALKEDLNALKQDFDTSFKSVVNEFAAKEK